MFLVGLTGGIATGKSTVSEYLRRLGCPVVDADKVAREVVKPGTRGWRKIGQLFGPEVFHENGELDREKMGQIIFGDPEKRKLLNSITHPEIYKYMLWEVFKLLLKGHQFAILDLPLLFETGKMVPYMTYTVVVACSEDEQLNRLMSRNNYTEEEATRRIQAQMSLDEKRYRASYVIENSGSLSDTEEQVKQLFHELRSSKAQWKLRIGVLSCLGFLTIFGCFVWSSLMS